MARKRTLFCPNCVSFLSQTRENAGCPECGAIHSPAIRRRLSDYAYEAYRFGYQYRVPFESQLAKQGEIREYYWLPAADAALVAAAFAILKGLASRVAY